MAREKRSESSARNRSYIEVIARLVMLHRGRVLLCRNARHGYLYLPGGHVEFGEPAAIAAEREVKEELGARVRAAELVLVSEACFNARKGHHEINLVFRAELPQRLPRRLADPTSLEKGIQFVWVDLAAVQDLDIRPNAVKAWLAAGLDDSVLQWISEIK